jgi:hypothetical protein
MIGKNDCQAWKYPSSLLQNPAKISVKYLEYVVIFVLNICQNIQARFMYSYNMIWYVIIKKSLNSVGHQFYSYQQKEQPPVPLTSKRIAGVMLSVLASSAEDRWFDSQSGQSK